MKLLLQTVLLFLIISSFTYSQTTILDDFEQGLGRFNSHVGHGGTTGIVHTTPQLDPTTPAANGILSLRIALIDNDTSDADWHVRFWSANGIPSNNIKLDSIGYIGFWMKTNATYLKTGVTLDAPDEPLGTEKSDSLDVIGDGEWHLYEWDLGDPSQWNTWGGPATNGKLEKPITLDAVCFYASNNDADADTVRLWLDLIYYSKESSLPVELTSFLAEVDKNIIDLKWITATEKNNKGFEIERKFENSSFEKISFVEGKGTTSEISSYIFSDFVNDAGKYTYRLKQIDFDGTFTYSNVIEIIVAAIPGKYSLSQNYPNPFNPVTSILFTIPETGWVDLTVYNLLGEEIIKLVNEVKESGGHNISFDAGNLVSGTYIYKLNVNGNSLARKLVLLK